MGVTYKTRVITEGNHASLPIPDWVLQELGANRRAPLRITINGHTYQSTATAVAGECRVVFPTPDRKAAGITGPDQVEVHLELDAGYRTVPLHPDFEQALADAGLRGVFDALPYSHRREHAKAIAEAKADDTRMRRIAKALEKLGASS